MAGVVCAHTETPLLFMVLVFVSTALVLCTALAVSAGLPQGDDRVVFFVALVPLLVLITLLLLFARDCPALDTDTEAEEEKCPMGVCGCAF